MKRSRKSKDSLRSYNVLRRGIATTAAIGVAALGTAGCDVFDGESAPPRYVAVPDQGKDFHSPTDDLANQIALTEVAVYDHEGNGEIKIPKGADKEDVIGLDQADKVRALEAAKDAINVFRFGDSYSVKSSAAGREIIDAIEDNEVRKVAQQTYRNIAIGNALQDVKFDDIEPSAAMRVIGAAGVSKKRLKKLRPVVDALEVSNLSYEGTPAMMRREARDIATPSIRRAVLKSASRPDDYALRRALYASETINKIPDGYESKGEKQYRALDKIAGQTDYDDAVTDRVAAFNDIARPDANISISPIADPTRPIDLSGVDGKKKIYTHDTEDDLEYLEQFGEVYVEDGVIKVHFEHDSDVDDTAKDQLRLLVDKASPFLAAAFSSGNLLTVRLIASEDYNPYFSPTSHEIVMVLPTDDSTSEDQFFSGLVHETTHALMGEEDRVSKEEITAIRTACRVLSKEAYDSAQSSFSIYPEHLESLIENASPKDRAVFEALRKKVETGSIDDLMLEKPIGIRSLHDTNCVSYTFGDTLHTLMEELKYEDIDTYYDEFFERFKENEAFSELIELWVKAVNDYSLYAQLSESNFVETEYWAKKYLGHPRDNADELIASIITGIVCYNDSVRSVYSDLIPEDKEAVSQTIDATTLLVANRHPELKKFLDQQKLSIVRTR